MWWVWLIGYGFLTLLCLQPSTAAPRLEKLFLESGGVQLKNSPPREPTAKRYRLARVNVRLLHERSASLRKPTSSLAPPPASRLILNLFNDEEYVARVERIEFKEDGRFICLGSIETIPHSQIIIACEQDVIAGSVFVPDRGSFQIGYSGHGFHKIIELDPSRVLSCGASSPANSGAPTPVHPIQQRSMNSAASSRPFSSDASAVANSITATAAASSLATLSPNSVTTIDVMVVYTAQAREGAGGASGMNTLIDAAVAQANTIYQNSQVNVRLNLVYRGEISYRESGDPAVDLDRLIKPADGFMDEVHSLRNLHNADLVCLIAETHDIQPTIGGIAQQMGSPSEGFESFAFSWVLRRDVAGTVVFAHELGHNMGCGHLRDNTSSQGLRAYPYSYGWRFTANGVSFVTVMADASGAQKILHFSNPNVLFQGVPTGVSEGSPDAADNAKTINNTASIVASFRGVPPAIVKQPANRTVTVGESVEFFAPVSGSGPLSYQWRFNGVDLIGATNSILSLRDVQVSQQGQYSVRVSNLSGSVSSAEAVLTVVTANSPDALSILKQPQSRTVTAGGTAEFSVEASGHPPLSYQWRFNGVDLIGATNSALSLTNVSVNQAGIYSVKVTSSPTSSSYTFDTDTRGGLEILGNNPEPWQPQGGNPSTGGFLALTYPQDFLNCHILFPELEPGKLVSAFKFECDLRIGNSHGDRAADGFSINFAREGDPVFALKDISPGRGYAGDVKAGGGEDSSLPETGTTTGLAICFDTWAGNALPDGTDIEGILVRVDNRTILRKSLPTRHGGCDNTSSLQTGPRDSTYWASNGNPRAPDAWRTLCWQPLEVELDAAGKLTVKWKRATLLDRVQTTYFPSRGRLILGGRTGAANEQTHFDNIRLTTSAAPTTSTEAVLTVTTEVPIPPKSNQTVTFDLLPDRTFGDPPFTLNAIASSALPVSLTVLSGPATISGSSMSITGAGTVVVRASQAGNATYNAAADVDRSFKVAKANQIITFGPLADKTVGDVSIPLSAAASSGLPVSFVLVSGPATLTGNTLTITGPGLVVVRATQAGNANFNAAASVDRPFTVASSNRPPTASLRVNSINVAGGRSHDLEIAYSDDLAIKISTVDSKDIRVTGPNGYDQLAALDYMDVGGDGTPRTAFYHIDAPGSAWTSAANGTYTVSMEPKQVSDTTDLFVAAGVLGTFQVNVPIPLTGPTILTQPQSQTVAVGTNATFTVSATGTEPLAYQWHFNGAPLAGATSPTLTLTNVQSSNAGDYSAVVSNANGQAVSASARLTVVVPPESLVRPPNDDFANRIALAGSPVSATGSNINASKEAGEPDHAGKPASRSVWWSWTALQSGAATISTAGSSPDTLLGVYTGTTLAALVPVTSNDDDPAGGTTSRVIFHADAETEYEIVVDAFGGGAGPIQLSVTLEIPRPMLRAELSGQNLLLSWPTNTIGFVLETTDNLSTPAWTQASLTAVVVRENYSVKTPISIGAKFYRLRRP